MRFCFVVQTKSKFAIIRNFKFFHHNVLINCLKLLGVRKRNKALDQALHRGITLPSTYRNDKV